MVLLFRGRSSLVSCCDRGKEHNLRIKTDDSQLERILWKHEGWLASLGHRYRHTLQCIIYLLRLLQLYTLVSLPLSKKINEKQ